MRRRGAGVPGGAGSSSGAAEVGGTLGVVVAGAGAASGAGAACAAAGCVGFALALSVWAMLVWEMLVCAIAGLTDRSIVGSAAEFTAELRFGFAIAKGMTRRFVMDAKERIDSNLCMRRIECKDTLDKQNPPKR